MINKVEIQDLIQEGDIEGAIQTFRKADLSTEKSNTLSVIEAEYYRLNQDSQRGIIGNEEKERRTNQINNKLLILLEDAPAKLEKEKSRKKFLLPFLLIGFILIVVAYFILPLEEKGLSCPTFNEKSVNKILLVPFVNVGESEAKPHLILRDEIEKLTIKKNLSTNIELIESKADISISKASEIAQSCNANVIIWGKYSNVGDSIRLILQYHFLEQPEWSSFGDLIVLKDVTEIQTGEMTKNLEDAIMSLCSVMAIRQNNKVVAKNWLAKVKEKEVIDMKIESILEN
jgi:hypothetical protein